MQKADEQGKYRRTFAVPTNWADQRIFIVFKGVMTDTEVWSNKYKSDIPGLSWDFPEFKGYYRHWRWVVFSTEQGDIRIVNGTKFDKPKVFGPESRKNNASGVYRGTVWFHFGG